MNGRERSSEGGASWGGAAGGRVLSQGRLAGRGIARTVPSEAPLLPGGARAALRGSGSLLRGQQGAREAGEVGSLCCGSHWSGQVPEPAGARPGPGARLPCKGNPSRWCQEGCASSVDMEVPDLPGSRGSLAGPCPTCVWRAGLWSHPAAFPKVWNGVGRR